ncbi:MAG: hypothetical protein EOM69_05845 [Clostridia bacterium]|nr:hypothetical protein [Clostridia bacterium]
MADMVNTKAQRDGKVVLNETSGAATQTIPWAGVCDERAYLIVRNTDTTTAATVVIKAGTGQRADIGDLTVTVAQSTAGVIGPLDSMRFLDRATGKVTVTLAGPTTITNVKLAFIYA